MIRLATLEDVPALGRIGAQFHREAKLERVADYVQADCEKSITQMIESPDGLCIVADWDGKIVGVAGGLAFPFYFNHGHKTGMEFFWWVAPEARGSIGARLFAALENEAKAMGCQSWTMIALDSIEPERTGKVYERHGYTPSERSYIKRF